MYVGDFEDWRRAPPCGRTALVGMPLVPEQCRLLPHFVRPPVSVAASSRPSAAGALGRRSTSGFPPGIVQATTRGKAEVCANDPHSANHQNEQWREANRRRQKQTIRYRGLVPTPPPPPPPPGDAPVLDGHMCTGMGHRTTSLEVIPEPSTDPSTGGFSDLEDSLCTMHKGWNVGPPPGTGLPNIIPASGPASARASEWGPGWPCLPPPRLFLLGVRRCQSLLSGPNGPPAEWSPPTDVASQPLFQPPITATSPEPLP